MMTTIDIGRDLKHIMWDSLKAIMIFDMGKNLSGNMTNNRLVNLYLTFPGGVIVSVWEYLRNKLYDNLGNDWGDNVLTRIQIDLRISMNRITHDRPQS